MCVCFFYLNIGFLNRCINCDSKTLDKFTFNKQCSQLGPIFFRIFGNFLKMCIFYNYTLKCSYSHNKHKNS